MATSYVHVLYVDSEKNSTDSVRSHLEEYEDIKVDPYAHGLCGAQIGPEEEV